MTDWEVAYATEPEQAAQVVAGANLVLIGGGTEEGLRLAEDVRELGITIAMLIVGDVPSPDGARHPVLVRPFTLDELHIAVERAVSSSQQSAPPIPVAVPSPPPEDKPLPVAPTKVEPKPPSGIPTGRRPHLEVAREPLQAPAASAATAAATAARVAPVEAPKPARAPEPVAPAPSPPAQEQPVWREKPVPPTVPAGVPRPPSAKRASERKLLRRGARDVPAEATENPVSAGLRAAYESMRSVEKAIDDLPVLTDLRDLTQALLGEVVDLLTPETAGIYLPGPDGFRVWASHNFSNVEKTMAVQTHQPLFADLLVRHESVLIEPLDMAQQLAAGVGGARTNAFLATPIEVNKKCVGVIVAGRGHFENEDLDRLAALADEASLGLGVALGLDRLRTKLT
ncbi:MAG TPA: GAF domain-containing protein [Actinomycetota bacterium]|nr:GAF domain-containing protein [Actinomycetota bacterium]